LKTRLKLVNYPSGDPSRIIFIIYELANKCYTRGGVQFIETMSLNTLFSTKYILKH